MIIGCKGIETLIGATNAVNYEREMLCRNHKEKCEECEFCNFAIDGKRCELLSTYNTLCKIIERECPKPKFERNRD